MRIYIANSLVIATLFLSVTGLSAHAEEAERFNALGFTLSGSTSLDNDSNSGAISIDYARILRGTRWYGSGFGGSVEYERERERDDTTKQSKENETIYLAAGVFYDLSNVTQITISLSKGVREKLGDAQSWKTGGNTLVNFSIGRDIETPIGSHTVSLRSDYDINEKELAIGFGISMAVDF